MKVLIVDDEVEVANFLCDFLKRLGLDSEKAINGQDAIATFNRINPDWVLLDMKMPDMDGLEVLKKMKAANANIKAIMITGKDDELTENEARSLGARDYLVKPIDMAELRTKIQTYIIDGK